MLSVIALCGAALLVVVAATCFLVLFSSTPSEINPDAWSSSFPVLILRALIKACLKSQGVLPKEWKVTDGKVEIARNLRKKLSVVQKGWRLNADVFAQYCQVCGQRKTGDSKPELLCFPESQFMRLFIAIVSSHEFPLSPLGLIHVRQTINTYASTSDIISQSCDFHCGVSEMREVEKGIEMDVKCDVCSCTEGKVLWSGVTTLLSRNQTTRTRTKQAKRNGERYSQPFSGEHEDSYSSVKFPVLADTGLRYASATGDYNPHHLYPWTARLVGYRLPMAHGMWTLAKTLTLIFEGSEHSISPPLHVSCSFKRPLYMPSEAVLLYTQLDKNQEMHFEVRDGETTAVLHLAGKITAL